MRLDLTKQSMLLLLAGTTLVQTCSGTFSTDSPLSALTERAKDFYRKGEYRESVAAFEELLLSPDAQENAELHAYVLVQIADADIELGLYRQAEVKANDAIQVLKQAQLTRSRVYPFAERMMADALHAEGYDEQAKVFAEDALVLGSEIYGPNTPDYAFILSSLGQIVKDLGRLDRAELLCRNALRILQQNKSTRPVDLGTSLENLAVVEALRGRDKEALVTIDAALAAWAAVLPPDHPFIVYALNTKMSVYIRLRAYRKADAILPRILPLAECPSGVEPERVFLLNDAAMLYIAEKQYLKAEPLLRQAVEVSQRCFKAGHPTTRNVLLNYANVLAQLGRNDEAARIREESQVIRAAPALPAKAVR